MSANNNANPAHFSNALLKWYTQHARDLPWRGHVDPYGVWVAEIMLQQTRVETVIPYFARWMARFPTIEILAAAVQDEVLAVWEGLGYYSRARNLHRAAQEVVAHFHGQLPADVQKLRTLPGIGPYTAGAIASFAFGLDEPVVDGNVRRVLARVFDLQAPAGSTQLDAQLWKLAHQHLPAGRAADYNQGLMDLGASICSPRTPACAQCPLAHLCQAYALGVQTERPVRLKKAPIPQYIVTAGVLRRNGDVLIARRPEKGLLGGLWEFPGGKIEIGETLEACLQRELQEELDVQVRIGEVVGAYCHAYTHFRVQLHAFYCQLMVGEPRAVVHTDLQWVPVSALENYPMGKIDRRIALDIRKADRLS